MQELRKRIQDDYNATLQKRISQREVVVSYSFYMSFKAYIFNDCIILGLCLFVWSFIIQKVKFILLLDVQDIELFLYLSLDFHEQKFN